eukprot:scaffold297268_cov21-Tisochrysis_lutea.AAC.1
MACASEGKQSQLQGASFSLLILEYLKFCHLQTKESMQSQVASNIDLMLCILTFWHVSGMFPCMQRACSHSCIERHASFLIAHVTPDSNCNAPHKHAGMPSQHIRETEHMVKTEAKTIWHAREPVRSSDLMAGNCKDFCRHFLSACSLPRLNSAQYLDLPASSMQLNPPSLLIQHSSRHPHQCITPRRHGGCNKSCNCGKPQANIAISKLPKQPRLHQCGITSASVKLSPEACRLQATMML